MTTLSESNDTEKKKGPTLPQLIERMEQLDELMFEAPDDPVVLQEHAETLGLMQGKIDSYKDFFDYCEDRAARLKEQIDEIATRRKRVQGHAERLKGFLLDRYERGEVMNGERYELQVKTTKSV